MNTLKYKGYTATVEFDPESKIFHGDVIDLNDVITFQSQDATKLEEEFHISVDTYLEFCRELGEDPEKPYSGTFNTRISPELHRLACVKATEENMSLNAFVAYAIEAAVNKDSKPQSEPLIEYGTIWSNRDSDIQVKKSMPSCAPRNGLIDELLTKKAATKQPIASRSHEKELNYAPAA